MYEIILSKKYQKSLKKIKQSSKFNNIDLEIDFVIDLICKDKKIPLRYKDHALNGKLKKQRECHIHSDLLLSYQIFHKEVVLVLINIGTHAELFK